MVAAAAFIVGYLGLGFVFDRFVFPEPDPDGFYYPRFATESGDRE